jgi:hypothetical protein
VNNAQSNRKLHLQRKPPSRPARSEPVSSPLPKPTPSLAEISAQRSAKSAQCLQELQELLLSLRDVEPSQAGPYTFQNEYEDFRLTFSTPHGARALSIISAICTPDPIVPGMSTEGLLWFNEGQRMVMSEIVLRLSGKRVTKAEEPETDYDPRDHI